MEAQQDLYEVNEDIGNAAVCAVIIDAIEREVVVSYVTQPDSASGKYVCNVCADNPTVPVSCNHTVVYCCTDYVPLY